MNAVVDSQQKQPCSISIDGIIPCINDAKHTCTRCHKRVCSTHARMVNKYGVGWLWCIKCYHTEQYR